MNNTIIGLDLAKNTFHHVETNRAGKEQRRKKLSRAKVGEYFAQLEPCSSSRPLFLHRISFISNNALWTNIQFIYEIAVEV